MKMYGYGFSVGSDITTDIICVFVWYFIIPSSHAENVYFKENIWNLMSNGMENISGSVLFSTVLCRI